MSEDQERATPERAIPEGDMGEREEDVEAHKVHEKVYEATEEGPDVEGHKAHPKSAP